MAYKRMVFEVTPENKVITPGVWSRNMVCHFEGEFYQVWYEKPGHVYSHQGAPWLYTQSELSLIRYERNHYGELEVAEVLKEIHPGRFYRSVIKQFVSEAKQLEAVTKPNQRTP